MKNIYTLLVLSIFATQIVVGQNLKKANNLFEKRAYLDAAELFLKEDVKSKEIYQKLGDCYYFNTQMKPASFYYKILLSKYSNEVENDYIYRYAQSLKGIGNYKEADTWMAKYLGQQNSSGKSNIATVDYIKNLGEKSDISYEINNLNLAKTGSSFGATELNNVIVFASSKENGTNYDWNKQPYLDLYKGTVSETGAISNIEPFSKTVNTKMHESNAVFTKDGKTMYFTRNNFINGKKGKDKNKISHLKIYKASLLDNEWSNITELPFNSNNYSVEHPALSPDEKQLYFASDMPGTIGSFDLFVVDILNDGTFGTPKNLGPNINTVHREQFPFIAKNEILYFASDGHINLGGLDIFKYNLNAQNEHPINMGKPLNSNLDDFSFSINTETEKGYFSTNRAKNSVDALYSVTEIHTYYVSGIVKNKNNGELIPDAEISLYNSDGTLINTIKSKEDASYSLKIERSNSYNLKATKKLYAPSEVNFSTNKKGDVNKNILLELELYADLEENIVVENNKTQIKIDPIYFDFDKWNIRPDAHVELDKIVSTMLKFDNMKIEVGAHTDCRGKDDDNLWLSEMRASSVKKYLIENGVHEKRITTVGYGETQPLNKCIKPGICKEKEYDINRRSEFVIIN